MATQTLSRLGQRLPSWTPWAVLAASVAVACGILALTGPINYLGAGILGGLLYALSMAAISWVKEGERWAKDRLATTLVTSAFLIVMVPLITLIAMVIAVAVAMVQFANIRSSSSSSASSMAAALLSPMSLVPGPRS